MLISDFEFAALVSGWLILIVGFVVLGVRGRRDLDPAVRAMVEALPRRGQNWPDKRRREWLEAVNQVLQITNPEG